MSNSLTQQTLATILGREVDELNLTVAKAIVAGMDPETLAGTMGIPLAEINDLLETQDYKDVRLLVGAEAIKSKVETDGGWDGIENTAVSKLQRRVSLENDTETLLKIAAVANRATRRVAPPKDSVLDPSQAGIRVPLTLTRRFTEKLSRDGTVERSETQQISVLNGSAVNPTFHEVSQLLQQPAEGAATESDLRKPTAGVPQTTSTTATQLARHDVDGDSGVDMSELMALANKLKR